MAVAVIEDRDYARLLAVRTRLRAFEQWSADRAAESGLTATQHQLLLAIRGHADVRGPTVGQAANYLFIRHNTAVELVNRTERAGLLARIQDPQDQRVVRLALTDEGRERLVRLTAAHIEELARLSPMIESLIKDINGP
jgi:DNA-binding MarR family transcriptional regulator